MGVVSTIGRLLSSSVGVAHESVEATLCVDASYANRVDNPQGFNYCLVPDGGADAVFFAGMAILAMSVASPRWDALMVLAMGAIYEVFAFQFNWAHFSNASALWLGMRPADIFVYVFLPPFLLDLAVRIDFYLFKKVLLHILHMAFVMVIVSTLVFIPFMLYGLNLQKDGWTATYVALFGSVIASTDAAAVAAALNSGGGPEILAILLEGESLFNDASSLTLFEIFKEMIEAGHSQPIGVQISHIVTGTLKAAAIGVGVGIAIGIFNHIVFIWLQWRNMPQAAEVAFTVGGCYVSFYIAQVWCKASGCVAAVAYGLYGASTLLFGLSMKARASGIFQKFWEVMTFIINGLIFFYVGASCVNFTWRSSTELYADGGISDLFKVIWYKLPLIWLVSFSLRGTMLYVGFKVLYYLRLSSENFSWQECLFVTMGGLRGSLSLVLASASFFIESPDPNMSHVRAEIAIYTAGFVIMTLLINAPLAAPLMTLLKLNHISPESMIMRKQVKGSFRQFTATSLDTMKTEQDDNEMLQGVDWIVVEAQTNHKAELDVLLAEENPSLRIKGGWSKLFVCDCSWIMYCISIPKAWMATREVDELDAYASILDKYTDGRTPTVGRISTGFSSLSGDRHQTKSLAAVSTPFAFAQEADATVGSIGSKILVFREPPPPEAILKHATAVAIDRAPTMRRPAGTKGNSRARLVRSGTGLPSENTGSRRWQPQVASDEKGMLSRMKKGLSAFGLMQATDKPSGEANVEGASVRGAMYSLQRGRKSFNSHAVKAGKLVAGDHNNTTDGDPSGQRSRSQTPFLKQKSQVFITSAPRTHSNDLGWNKTASKNTGTNGAGDGNGGGNSGGTWTEVGSAEGCIAIEMADAPPAPPQPPVPPPAPPPPKGGTRGVGEGIEASEDTSFPARALQNRSRFGSAEDLQQSATSFSQASDDPINVPKAARPASSLLVVKADAKRGDSNMGMSNAHRLVQGKDGAMQPMNIAARPLGRSSVGGRTMGFADPSSSLGRASVGGRTMGFADPSSSLGQSLMGGPRQSRANESPPIFESPPGHEMDGISGSVPQPAAVSRLRNHTSAHRSLGTRSTSYVCPPPVFESPPGHEMDGISEGSKYVFESPAGHEMDGLGQSGMAPPRNRTLRSLASQSVGSAAFGSMKERGEHLISRGSVTSSAFLRDISEGDRQLHHASTENTKAMGGGAMSAAAERALMSLDAPGRRLAPTGAGERPIGRGSVSNLVPTGLAALGAGIKQKFMDGAFARGSTGGSLTTTSEQPPLTPTSERPPLGTTSRQGERALAALSRGSAAVALARTSANNTKDLDKLDVGALNLDNVPHLTNDMEAASITSMDNQMLGEFRMRLLTGLKQYYKGKFTEGVLSAQAFKILHYCCDAAHHHPDDPINLWELAKEECSSGGVAGFETKVAYKLKQWDIAAMSGHYGSLCKALLPPLLFLPLLAITTHLDGVKLVALETAVELWISLTTSLQTQWLEYSGVYGAMLLEEVQESADGAWAHIVERRIEVPETFQAIQTYRASVSLLSQQRSFILEMSEGGMIEEKESKLFVEVIGKRFQTVCRAGPQWQRQSVTAILAGTSFLRGASPKVIEWVRRNCTMKSYKQGEVLWEHGNDNLKQAPCVFIVVSGVIRMTMQIADEEVPMYLGTGGVGGMVNMVLGDYVPGVSMLAAYCEGNSFGRGPVLLKLPNEVFSAIRQFSRVEGMLSYQHLELNMHRTAASNVLDLLRGMVTAQLGQFVREMMVDFVAGSHRMDSALFKRQHIRSLLREGMHALGLEGDAGVGMQLDWIGELLRLDEEEAANLLELGEVGEYPWHELMFKAIAAATHAVYDTIRTSLKESIMLVIPPGETVLQTSTMVLIQGSLVTMSEAGDSGHHLKPPASGPPTWTGHLNPLQTLVEGVSTAEQSAADPHTVSVGPAQMHSSARAAMVSSLNADHVAPSVMVWTNDYFDGEEAEPVPIAAGPKGATLMVLVDAAYMVVSKKV